MTTPLREQTHLWQAPALGDVEMLHARYFQQRFAPHVHEGYVFTVIESGAQRFWHRGSEHLAPVGSMVLINPTSCIPAPPPMRRAGAIAASTPSTSGSPVYWTNWNWAATACPASGTA